MSKRDAVGLRNIDWATFSIFLALVGVGVMMIYAVSSSQEASTLNFFDTSAGKQVIWVGISLMAFIVIFAIDWKFWQTFAYFIYAFSIVLLVAVLFLGTTIKGATSWFIFGGASFQPSEVAKFGTSLAMSAFLSNYRTNLKTLRSQLIAFSIFLIPIVFILLQPDAGSAIVFLSFLFVLFREGLSPTYYLVGIFSAVVMIVGLIYDPVYIILALLILGIGILIFTLETNRRYWIFAFLAIIAGGFFVVKEGFQNYALIGAAAIMGALSAIQWRQRKQRMVSFMVTAIALGAILSFAANFGFNNVLQPHQQDRINVWLQPSKADKRGSLYNVFQSKLAIGSGGLQGKGYLEGTLTKLNYVPEQSTDFIFCTIGEEQGFIGSFGIIVLFLLLMVRITIIAERQKSNFSRHYAYSVAGILFIHFFINIGMTMGLMPIIGIPLPFISKGGSSLLGFTIMIAVLLKLDSNRYRI